MARVAVRKRKRSSVAGVSSGAPFSCQSGISSLSARGSSTAPDRMWAPISLPFSTRQTDASGASCFNRIAAASPDGPPPTITTSNSIASLGGNSSAITRLRSYRAKERSAPPARLGEARQQLRALHQLDQVAVGVLDEGDDRCAELHQS